MTRNRMMTYLRSMICLLLMAWTTGGIAQTIQIENATTLQELFQQVEQQTQYRFVYSEEAVDLTGQPEITNGAYELDKLLNETSGQLELEFEKVEETIVVTKIKQQSSKQFHQKVKGTVADKQTGETLPGANIVLTGGANRGTTTDSEGYFSMQAPLGRQSLIVSFVGYKTKNIPLLINSGQEPYLTIELEPNVSELSEVEIKAEFEKAKPINKAAYTSGRSFSIDEAYRYAGTLGDPARMVRSYAGVVPERDDRNDIIIRGNSPVGLLWRIDGIEVPNPNHFGGIGLTGNTVTLLNPNMLGNSDFLTGAFPSEYGNALAGVFDLKLKKPNPEKHQFRVQTGWNGLELGAKGPINKKNKSTYSAAYRYSFLDILDEFGVDMGVLPQYQDFTAKVDIPVSDKLNISGLGIWGTSFIELDDHDAEERPQGAYGEHLKTGSDIALGGVNARYRLNNKTVINSGLSVIYNEVNTGIDTFSWDSDVSNAVFGETSVETKYSFFTDVQHYSSRKNKIKAGVRWDTYDVSYEQKSAFANGTYKPVISSKDQLNLLRIYGEDEYRFTSRLKARAGLHAQFLFLNNSVAVEPRFGLQYSLADNQLLSLSYGNHHQVQPRNIYFVRTATPSGTQLTNKDLDFSAAHHIVAGYDYFISNNWRLKTEAYYQYLYDIPIKPGPDQFFSMVNVGADFYIPKEDSLVNRGIGRNYGLEVTLEKFLSENYYFMLNGTAFQSEFQGGDGAWRNSAFNVNYIFNALGGYEYWVTSKIALGADLRATVAGGKPYVPVDEAASVAKGEVVYKTDGAYQKRYGDYFRTDLKLYYRINYKKAYLEFAVDFQNLLNSKNIYRRGFSPETGEYTTFYHMGFFPMYTMRFLF